MAEKQETALDVLASCLAFNWSFRQTNSVEKALAYANEHGKSPSFLRESECLISGLQEAGFAIVDRELH